MYAIWDEDNQYWIAEYLCEEQVVPTLESLGEEIRECKLYKEVPFSYEATYKINVYFKA